MVPQAECAQEDQMRMWLWSLGLTLQGSLRGSQGPLNADFDAGEAASHAVTCHLRVRPEVWKVAGTLRCVTPTSSCLGDASRSTRDRAALVPRAPSLGPSSVPSGGDTAPWRLLTVPAPP